MFVQSHWLPRVLELIVEKGLLSASGSAPDQHTSETCVDGETCGGKRRTVLHGDDRPWQDHLLQLKSTMEMII